MDKKKTKGPIRFEAIVPFTIVVILIAVYFTLFFDGHLRRGLEWGATQGNGAEVNIGYLKTSWLGGSFSMGKIQVTDLKDPSKNKFEIGQVTFKFSWDALLRAKVLIETAAINRIEVGTDRKFPGKVLPPADPKDSLFSKFMAKAKEKSASAALSQMSNLMEGGDPSKALGDATNLKSVAKVNALNAELTAKQAEWQNSLAKIPGEKDFSELEKKLTAIPTSGVKNPAEVAARAKALQDLIGEATGKITAVQTLGSALTQDVEGFQNSLSDVDKLAKADREDLEKKLKLPSLDAKQLSSQIFGTQIVGKVQQAEHYIALARKYMPPKKAKKSAETQPERAHGKTYQFPITRSYPLFWLKKAEISSKGEHSPLGGDVSGEILNVSSDPSYLREPATMILNGDFPKRDLRDLKVQLTIDHRTDMPLERLMASVGGYPVSQQILSDSETLKFGFERARGAAGVSATVQGDMLNLTLDNRFREITYSLSSSSKLLESTLQSVTKELPQVEVQAKINGPFDDLDLSVESNLGRALEQGIGKQLQAKLDEARKKIADLIQAKIGKPKQELTQRFTDSKAKVTGEVEKRKQQAEAVKKQAEGKLKAVTSQASTVKDKAADMLKKKFKF